MNVEKAHWDHVCTYVCMNIYVFVRVCVCVCVCVGARVREFVGVWASAHVRV